MERIAIIDLGSNSIRFIIMQIGEHGAYKLIYQEKKSIRLAEGMTLTSRLLTEEAQQRASTVLPFTPTSSKCKRSKRYSLSRQQPSEMPSTGLLS